MYEGKCGSCIHMDLRNYDWVSGCLCEYRDMRYDPEYDGVERLGCSHYQYFRSDSEVEREIRDR